MTKDGVAVPLTMEAVQNGYGENAIVFFPTGSDTTQRTVPVKPTQDTTYTVTITNVLISGAPQNFTYSVTVFDPAVGSSDPPVNCTYGLSLGGQAFGPAGGSGSITVSTGAGCAWTLTGVPSWYTLRTAQRSPQPGSCASGLRRRITWIRRNPIEEDS